MVYNNQRVWVLDLATGVQELKGALGLLDLAAGLQQPKGSSQYWLLHCVCQFRITSSLQPFQ